MIVEQARIHLSEEKPRHPDAPGGESDEDMLYVPLRCTHRRAEAFQREYRNARIAVAATTAAALSFVALLETKVAGEPSLTEVIILASVLAIIVPLFMIFMDRVVFETPEIKRNAKAARETRDEPVSMEDYRTLSELSMQLEVAQQVLGADVVTVPEALDGYWRSADRRR